MAHRHDSRILPAIPLLSEEKTDTPSQFLSRPTMKPYKSSGARWKRLGSETQIKSTDFEDLMASCKRWSIPALRVLI